MSSFKNWLANTSTPFKFFIIFVSIYIFQYIFLSGSNGYRFSMNWLIAIVAYLFMLSFIYKGILKEGGSHLKAIFMVLLLTVFVALLIVVAIGILVGMAIH